jgi:hypothetical protein
MNEYFSVVSKNILYEKLKTIYSLFLNTMYIQNLASSMSKTPFLITTTLSNQIKPEVHMSLYRSPGEDDLLNHYLYIIYKH